MSSIKKFAIIGERCTGTNFLEKIIKNSFHLENVKGSTDTIDHKHWMQPENFVNVDNGVLYIGIIRDPIQWLSSFFRKQYHVPFHMRKDIQTFMTSEWYSINDEKDLKEIIYDRQPFTKERFKNIFELRKVKAEFLTEFMPHAVKNYIFVRYEDLLDKLPVILNEISEKFNLPILKSSHKLIKRPKTHKFSLPITKLIEENIDLETERKLGYLF